MEVSEFEFICEKSYDVLRLHKLAVLVLFVRIVLELCNYNQKQNYITLDGQSLYKISIAFCVLFSLIVLCFIINF